ncbi:unnamed protein product [Rotaria sp. Silwood2]|nr:unnamed protein product [Rotaria sp. Silwood2]CAF4273331.1 unnamed protein product [Rotaria sp. Silwood2]
MITMMSSFDDLPDLTLLEIFSYLSCADALWSFSNLNSRLITLLKERGFYHHLNLSSTRRKQFETILSILQLNQIESLVIDRYASPLQLRRWPYLPNLTTLRLQGVRNFRDVFKFARKHANTLSHLTVQSSGYFRTNKKLKYRLHLFYTLPWIFEEFFQLCISDKYISELEVFTSASLFDKVGRSHLLKMNIADNIPSLTTLLPHVMSSNHVVELHLSQCDEQISSNLTIFDHLILTNSFDSLNN